MINQPTTPPLAPAQQPPLRQALAQPAPQPALAQAQPMTAQPDPAAVADRVKDKKLIAAMQGITPHIEHPDDLAVLNKSINAISPNISEEDKHNIQERKDKLDAMEQAAQQAYTTAADKNQWSEVAERIGNAMVKLGAGAYGMKHGVDMSGVQFDKHNWAADTDRSMSLLEKQMQDIGYKRKAAEGQAGDIQERASKDADFRKHMILSDYTEKQRALNERAAAAQRLAEQVKHDDLAISRMDAKDRAEASREADRKRAEAAKEIQSQLRDSQKEVANLDKAYAAANSLKGGEKGASIDRVATILGGEQGEKFQGDITKPTKLLGFNLWSSMNEDEAPSVEKGYLNQAKAHQAQLAQSLAALQQGSQPQEQEPVEHATQSAAAPVATKFNPGDVYNKMRFKGGNQTDKNNWEAIK